MNSRKNTQPKVLQPTKVPDHIRSVVDRILVLMGYVALASIISISVTGYLAMLLRAGAVGTDVLTYKNNLARTGQNVHESILTLANVRSPTFGLLRVLYADGAVFAQPLYVSMLNMAGARHNMVYVATEHNSVYAYEADSGALFWRTTLNSTGEAPSDNRGCEQITPEIGISSTPVIDRTVGPNGAIYLVAMTRDASGRYHQRLHALDLTNGVELFNGPTEIAANYSSDGGGSATFDPGAYKERAALLLLNGEIYTTWSSHCDQLPYGGWIIAYDQATLRRSRVLNVGPNGNNSGPGIWMSGGGPAADAQSNIYLLTGNGPFETALDANGFPIGHDFGNSFLKIATANGSLKIVDYFTMYNVISESSTYADLDLGSGGVMLLPDLRDGNGVIRHLAVGAGKDGNIYVVNRDSMGGYSPSHNAVWQELIGVVPQQVRSTPAYFNNTVYYEQINGPLKAFSIAAAMLSHSPTSQAAAAFAYPGTVPAVSANGNANGIVWVPDRTESGALHAYNATDLSVELYNSMRTPNGRDNFGAVNKFATPTIADGKVLVAAQDGVAVFGLLE